ncbi:MAG TPA: PP2C family serine/threonine-protein phosphatase [Holophagaceae bacterium]|jgi:protein phosphatase|nr:PP2C family serine/threonine-protein phosphatase [Holophagaceae bacterium]
MQIDYAAITHPGRIRKNNEDAYLLSALDGDEPVINEGDRGFELGHAGFLIAVADGMGGAASGEIASREGLAALNLHLYLHWGRFAEPDGPEDRIVSALTGGTQEASRAVLRYADSERASRGMGSTLTSMLIWNRWAYIAQVGDSRAYLLRAGELHQLTTDQTLVHELISQGALTPEEAKTHPQRNMITQALGSTHPLRIPLSRLELRRGDRILCCSDGLHGEVPDERIREILRENLPPRRLLEALVDAANAHGGRDNITGVLLMMDDPALPPPLPEEQFRLERPGSGPSAETVDLDTNPGLLGRMRRLLGAKA